MNAMTVTYDDLPVVPETGEHYAWPLWGAGDQLGTINRLTKESVLRAASLIRTGQVVSLGLPLDQPDPGLFERDQYERHEIRTSTGREDSLAHFDLQFSTQWDGLRHIEHRKVGYYGGRTDEQIDKGELGIEHMATRGIVTRGVLVDIPAYFAAENKPYRPDIRIALGPEEIEKVLRHQGVALEYGDVLVVHTGWLEWYLALPAEERQALQGSVDGSENSHQCVGLTGTIDMARWLWNSGLAAVASDNAAVEAFPVQRSDGFLHRRVLPLLGMPLGELWSLKELSMHCRNHETYEFFLSSAPMIIRSGVASPANALAIL